MERLRGNVFFRKTPLDVFHAESLSHPLCHRQDIPELFVEDQVFDGFFLFVGQLEAVATEDFKPVVLIGIVGGRYHDAGIGAHALGDKGNTGSGQHADQVGVSPHGGYPRFERAFQHVSGNPGVLPDDDPGAVTVLFKYMRHGLPDAECDLCIHGIAVCFPPYPVGSK
jgi:hypothetical protein